MHFHDGRNVGPCVLPPQAHRDDGVAAAFGRHVCGLQRRLAGISAASHRRPPPNPFSTHSPEFAQTNLPPGHARAAAARRRCLPSRAWRARARRWCCMGRATRMTAATRPTACTSSSGRCRWATSAGLATQMQMQTKCRPKLQTPASQPKCKCKCKPKLLTSASQPKPRALDSEPFKPDGLTGLRGLKCCQLYTLPTSGPCEPYNAASLTTLRASHR
eukprot:357343-Chlamydomonas_euryale.AAC.1